jgi:hypothetical protein
MAFLDIAGVCLLAFAAIAVIEGLALAAVAGVGKLPQRALVRIPALLLIGALGVGGTIWTIAVAYHRIAPLLPAI